MKLHRPQPRSRRERGGIMIVMACAMPVLIACIGLALDGGLMLQAKARLQNAVDGAALAGGRALQRDNSEAGWQNRARTAALAYFHSAYYGRAPSATDVAPDTVAHSLDPIWVEVSAKIGHPLFFMPVLGFKHTMIHAAAEAKNDAGTPGTADEHSQRRTPVDVVMVADMSGSILQKPKEWANVIAESQSVYRELDAGQDRLAKIVFSSEIGTLLSFNKTGKGFNEQAVEYVYCLMQHWQPITPTTPDDRINCNVPNGWQAADTRVVKERLFYSVNGDTATGPALEQAIAEFNGLPLSPGSRLRVLLVFTDGIPNRYCAKRDGRQACAGIANAANDSPLPVTQMLVNVQKALDEGILVLIVGYGDYLKSGSLILGPNGRKQGGEAWLLQAIAGPGASPALGKDHTYANGNGMYCWSGDQSGLKECYNRVLQHVFKPGTSSLPGTGPLRLVR